MRFEPLTSSLIAAVETWFDEPETIRYLGGRNWVLSKLNCIREAPGATFRDTTVLARHVWVVFDEADQPVGLVDVELYDDGAAGAAFVVAPHARGRGVGQRMLLALTEQLELKDVHTVIGGVEPENTPCRICLTKAGFTIAQEPDDEGMLAVEKKLR